MPSSPSFPSTRAARAGVQLIAGVSLVIAASGTAHAGRRAYVASTGNDLNSCTRAKPCRNFQRGVDKVASGGEVVAMDSASYGTINVSKSVTISSDTGHATIFASSGIAVAVNGPSSGRVVLRRISIEQGGAATFGVGVGSTFSGGQLLLEDCRIQGFPVGVEQVSDSSVVLRRTTIRSPLSGTGVLTTGFSAQASLLLDGSTVQGGDVGLSVGLDAHASVVDSTFLGAATRAIDTQGVPSHAAHTSVDRSGFEGNSIAISARGASAGVSAVDVARSAITANGAAFEVDAGQTLESRGDNTVMSNTAVKISSGTLTTFSPL